MKGSFFILLAIICASFCLCHGTSTRKVLNSAAREATLSGRCMTLEHETSLTDAEGDLLAATADADNQLQELRSSYVKYNTKKSMYRDGDVLEVYELRDRYRSLAGCANACLLDWAMNKKLNQTKAITEGTDWNPSKTEIDPIRECEYFNFNIDTGKCTLISGQTSTQLTSSDNYWSGKLICADLDNIQDWAEQVVAG
ncbi:hypothetical protein PSENEW3n2_00003869 [Picochlorum sp. SENEW3]|nr:hypothetical protein PSENEW3n2_00003869 [Picochlorum sp. SENEW3]WPT18569.1 hypothetical protein PSENEW3_00003869 [Picochlorum sp. SENEW3]